MFKLCNFKAKFELKLIINDIFYFQIFPNSNIVHDKKVPQEWFFSADTVYWSFKMFFFG